MFGYIRPHEPELRVRELNEYRGYYCGLCKTIGRHYGNIPRLVLSYDCAFLAAYLCAAVQPASFQVGRCAVHCLRPKHPIADANSCIEYAADINVLLSTLSLRDHVHDERNIGARMASGALEHAFKNAKKSRNNLYERIQAELERLNDIEKRNEACTDEPADAFGCLMRAVIEESPIRDDLTRRASGWLFYNLGRWVYLIDAWDDRRKDLEKKSYNPFNIANTSKEEAEFLLYTSLGEAEKGFDLVDFAGDSSIIDNIIHLGCLATTQRILQQDNDKEKNA